MSQRGPVQAATPSNKLFKTSHSTSGQGLQLVGCIECDPLWTMQRDFWGAAPVPINGTGARMCVLTKSQRTGVTDG